MEFKTSDKLPSTLPKYLYRGQHDRTDELNERILERSEPENPLAPNFSPRPVLTRYSRFPMLDARMPANVPINPSYNYSLHKEFTPPVEKIAPVSGFINNVNVESDLRNQNYALHKGNDEVVYVPSSDSDLYKVYIPSAPSKQPHPGLFNRYELSQILHPNVQDSAVGKERFHNNTRTQLRTMSNKNI